MLMRIILSNDTVLYLGLWQFVVLLVMTMDNIMNYESVLYFAVNILRFLYLQLFYDDGWIVNSELEIKPITAVLAKSK